MITLTVNGVKKRYEGDPQQPLLWYLREDLALTGTKYGCGIGVCGACTVHVDGIPKRACSLPMQAVADTTVVTIEGLSTTVAEQVQASWQALDVVQCGYCQSGQIMSAVALLEKTPAPSDQQIADAMSGNLCRCATYGRIRTAIQQASAALAEEV